MSTVFYDYLIILDEVDAEIKASAKTKEEKEELWQIVDEIIHHRVMDVILSRLPRESHEEFLEKFTQSPHDKKLISYLREKIKDDVEKIIHEEIAELKKEILSEIHKKK